MICILLYIAIIFFQYTTHFSNIKAWLFDHKDLAFPFITQNSSRVRTHCNYGLNLLGVYNMTRILIKSAGPECIECCL